MNAQDGVIGRERMSTLRLRENLANFDTQLVSAASVFALVANAAFFEALTSSRLLVVLVGLLALHVLTCPRLWFCREVALYGAFVAYMIVALLWTPDPVLALNTLFPAVDFVLIQVLFGSLLAFRDQRAVMQGMLAGFWLGALAYTYVEGFPFSIPVDFSYNGVASMYLFGLIATLFYAWVTRSRLLPLAFTLVLILHIAATTSIKTNLGVLLGAAIAGLVYSKLSMSLIRRNAVLLTLAVVGISVAVLSNPTATDQLKYAYDRVTVGVEVLQAREDMVGYQGFDERRSWFEFGMRGWAANPVFGYGPEAFRADVGITSHSTIVDLLYNTGLVGLLLFYSMLLWPLVRLVKAPATVEPGLKAIVLASVSCYVFMSLSATLFYQSFLAAFVAMAAVLLVRPRATPHRDTAAGQGVPS